MAISTTRGRATRAGFLMLGVCGLALTAGQAMAETAKPFQVAVAATGADPLEAVIVTARQRAEDVQKVPGGVSVVGSAELDATYTNSINQLQQLSPSLSYNSPNPRNTAFTVRGLGSSVVAVSQANDGLEPGVGFYVDQVYHARPATAAFDFTDIERVEVLRGPQGTLFGKNTTAGAISLTTKLPTFTPSIEAEATAGNYGYGQFKMAVSGPLVEDKLAVRLSGAVARRGGVIHNVVTNQDVNTIGTNAIRGEVLYKPTSNFNFRLTGDYTDFRSTCCTQVYYTVAPTLKAAARQYPALAAGLNYRPPSLNPYDRLTDIDAMLGVRTSEGGVSAISDWDLGFGVLTSVSAWRFWNWDAANDRDYTSVVVQTLQHIPSHQDQYSQELRLASKGENKLDYVIGAYWFNQVIKGEPITQYGSQAAYWLLGPEPATPANLLDGYFTDGSTKFLSNSYAAFGEATFHVTDKLNVTGGLRYTDEKKNGRYDSFVGGGLVTTTTALVNMKLSILRPQSYTAQVSDGSLSGRGNISYQLTPGIMAYASYARGQKSGGINMSGLPLDAANNPAIATAVIRPEKNTTFEVGVKTRLFGRHLTLNADLYDTRVRDFQTNVVDTGPGALRGYLANIPRVRVKGFEMDGNLVVDSHLSMHLAATYADGEYANYKAGPCPIELIGASTTVCNLTGRPLTALPKWVVNAGGEYAHELQGFGQGYVHLEVTKKTKSFGDPSDSAYTLLAGYTVVNGSVGVRRGPFEFAIWARNLFDKNYMQNVTIQAGNSGLVVGTPGDPKTYGATLRLRY